MDKILNALKGAEKGAEKTFVAWAAKVYTVFHNTEPGLVALSDKALPYIKGATTIALQLEGASGLAPAVLKIEDEVHNSADVLMGLIYDFGATPKAMDILGGIKANLQSLLTLGHIKSPKAVDAVTKAVDNANALGLLLVDGAKILMPPAPTA